MIWTTESNSDGTIVAKYNFKNAFLRQRMILHIELTGVPPADYVTVNVRGNTTKFKYYLTYRGVDIICNDFFADFSVGDVTALEIDTIVLPPLLIPVDIKGLVDPSDLIIPTINNVVANKIPILPPSKIIKPLYYNTLGGCLEIYNNVTGSGNYTARNSGGVFEGTGIPYYDITKQYRYKDDTNRISVEKDGDVYHVYPVDPICSRRYAMVSWTSRLGARKIMTWEVRGVTEKLTDSVDIMNKYSYFNRKNAYEQEIVLHMDGLTRYDYWYYSDIILSNDVRVAMSIYDVESFTVIRENCKVEIVTQSVSQPDANGLYSLDVQVKLKNYVYTT